MFHWHDLLCLLAQFIRERRTSRRSVRSGLKSRIPCAQNYGRPFDRDRRVNPDGSPCRVTSRLTLHFLDGSIDDDLTIFTQRNTFRLISDHHIQRGPSFPKPIDFLIDAVSGQTTSRDKDGKLTQEHLDLPPDVSNGLPPNLLLNILPSTAETKIAYVVPGAKPRVVHLSIRPTGVLPFTVGSLHRQATDFTIHVELGGIAGVVAPILGKEPSDYHIWLQDGTPPAFVREEGPLYEGGPIWRLEEMSPTFTR
jgi:hypothetical protein